MGGEGAGLGTVGCGGRGDGVGLDESLFFFCRGPLFLGKLLNRTRCFTRPFSQPEKSGRKHRRFHRPKDRGFDRTRPVDPRPSVVDLVMNHLRPV